MHLKITPCYMSNILNRKKQFPYPVKKIRWKGVQGACFLGESGNQPRGWLGGHACRAEDKTGPAMGGKLHTALAREGKTDQESPGIPKTHEEGLPGAPVVESLPDSAGDTGSILVREDSS